MTDPLHLLVVCLGNICRSPMAEGILRARIEQSALSGRVLLDSAGTGDWHVGRPPDPRAIATAARHGVDIAGLRGRQLSSADFDRFDWILCADSSNLRNVRALAPRRARAQSALLLEWSGQGAGEELPDPYTCDDAQFDRVWRMLDRAADGAVERLLGNPA